MTSTLSTIQRTLSLCALFVLTLYAPLGCGGDGNDDDISAQRQLSKTEARSEMARADNAIDYCSLLGWYGDSICDDFCYRPDPDCTGSCSGEDPSASQCSGDGDCAAGEVCQASTDCVPSACYCNAATGTWDCTADCSGQTHVCQSAPQACPGEDPSASQCASDSDCGKGEVCQASTDCVPSACYCNAATGTWDCTADCSGQANVCH